MTTVTAVLPAFFRSTPSTDADADPDAATGENASRKIIFLVKRVVLFYPFLSADRRNSTHPLNAFTHTTVLNTVHVRDDYRQRTYIASTMLLLLLLLLKRKTTMDLTVRMPSGRPRTRFLYARRQSYPARAHARSPHLFLVSRRRFNCPSKSREFSVKYTSHTPAHHASDYFHLSRVSVSLLLLLFLRVHIYMYVMIRNV